MKASTIFPITQKRPFILYLMSILKKKMIYVFKNVHVVDVSFYLIEPIARFLNFKQRLMQNDNLFSVLQEI